MMASELHFISLIDRGKTIDLQLLTQSQIWKAKMKINVPQRNLKDDKNNMMGKKPQPT